ncbi:helix-turn-helix domain-containing protein [Lentzea sp. NPDC060358]|uniref:helix-turn-helix domain-containing protein n=1 Tax=Lentzea sp. NPDC060358 TaxID=3347103 RepID=UPI0036640A11
MARPEAEIDGSTPEGEFALGLRALRDKARLDYRAMEKLVHFAASTLSKAASGNGLPTLEVTLAYVRACAGDEQEWEARWRELNSTSGRARRPDTGAVPTQRGSEARRATRVEKSANEAEDLGGADEPELSGIPEQLTGEQESDPEATDRIPRVDLPATARVVPGGPRLSAPARPGAHRAVQPLSRRTSAWAIAILVLINFALIFALVWSANERTTTPNATMASSIQLFEIAEIGEPPLVLKAGAVELRWVDLRNPNATDLVVTELTAQVKILEDDSLAGFRSCPPGVLKISNLQNFPYRIDAHGITRVGFKFEVATALPGGCEGRSFPVSYDGKAIQGTVIEGRVQTG